MPVPARTPDEILRQFEQGQLTGAEAFARLRALDSRQAPLTVVRRSTEGRAKPSDDEAERQRRLAAIMDELDSLIGLDEVKLLVREVQAFLTIQQRRRGMALNTEPLVLHMVFKGKPLNRAVMTDGELAALIPQSRAHVSR